MEAFLSFLKVAVSLALVLFLAYWFMRYLLPKLQGGYAPGRGNMQFLERLPLAPRSYICLVRVGKRCFLLGVTQTEITCLAEIDDTEIKTAADYATVNSPGFSEILKKSREKISSFGARAGTNNGNRETEK